MFPEKLIAFFLPSEVRHNKTHPRYYELSTIVSPILAGIVFLGLIPLPLLYFHIGKDVWMYYINVACNFITLFSIRRFGHYRIPNYFCGAVAYLIIFSWLEDYGLIYSTNMGIVHMYLLGAVLTDKKWGWTGIVTNVIFIGIIYYKTVHSPLPAQLSPLLGSPEYALAMHAIITVFLGGFLASTIRTQEQNRKEISRLQDQKINLLDEAVRERTEQLGSMRQTIATDFHDQTGNMLAAITRQAASLELRLLNQPEVLPMVRSIIANADALHASSKDLLWNLNYDSDDPLELFRYLSGYGQRYYNQFDIAFSTLVSKEPPPYTRLHPLAGLNLIYIFKEAMSNVVRHSGADEVCMELSSRDGALVYALQDNGRWKEPAADAEHYGLGNMERRCHQSGFGYELRHGRAGTRVAVSLPVSTDFVHETRRASGQPAATRP